MIINKKSHSGWRALDLDLLNQFQYCQVIVDMGVIIYFDIPFIITFLYFV